MESTPFKTLAATFKRLERTSSSTTMIDILARTLRALSAQNVKMTAYLLSGKVGPSFSAPEFGIAQVLAERAVADACASSLAKIRKLSVRLGDLGAAAEHLIRQRGARLSIARVFNALAAIAGTTGAGAQKAKTEALAALLRQTSSLEAKYIVRIVLGTHRLGVAEMTFLHALAKGFAGGVKDKHVLEQAYNVLSDLGEVAYRVASGGAASLRRIKPRPGVPVRMMLASRVGDLDEVLNHLTGELFVEYKYDGERVQIHKDARGSMDIFSRRLENITHQYPEVIAHVRKALKAKTAIIEGEVVAINPRTKRLLPFQIVMQRKRKHEIERYQREVPVALFLFDILFLNGKSLLSTLLVDRKRMLVRHLKADRKVHVGTFIRTQDITEAERYFHQAVSQGAEGVVIKGAASPYQAGHRGWYWIKFKKEYQKELADTFDVVIVGATYGKGMRAGSFGSVLAAAFDPAKNKFFSFTKVGAGLTDKMLSNLPKVLKPYTIPKKHRLLETNMKMDVWFEPVKVIEISGANLTISPVHTVAQEKLKRGGIALRFPRLLRFRNDKTAEQATSVAEIWAMYRESQHKTA
jgi:DNA ligase-1